MEETLSSAQLFEDQETTISSSDLFGSDDIVSSSALFGSTGGEEIGGVPQWGRENPNLYGLYGAAKETAKSAVPYARYLDPADREALLKKDTQGQTNELLMETLNTEAMLATGPLLKGVGAVLGPVAERFTPGLYKALTKERFIGQPKSVETIPEKPVSVVEPPPPEVISSKELLSAEPVTKVVAEVAPKIETAIAPPPAEIVEPGANVVAVAPFVDTPRPKVNAARGPQNLVTYLEKQGGVNWGPSYDAPIMRQHPDGKRVSRQSGQAPDVAAEMLNGEGWVSPDGKPFTGDSLAETVKSGQGRNVFAPEKNDVMMERKLNREWEQHYADIEAGLREEGIDPGAIGKSIENPNGRISETLRAEGIDLPQEIIDAELSDYFDVLAKKHSVKGTFTNETGELPGASARETFSLANPETEISRGVKSQKDMTPTGGLDLLAKEQTAQSQKGMVGLDIGQKEPKPTYKFDSSETEYLFQSARGIKPEGIGNRIRAVATEIGHKFTRDFENLAKTKENAQLIFDLKRLEKQKDVVADRTVRSIGETVSGLNQTEYDLFNREVVINDLLSDHKRGLYTGEKELPFKFTPESLTAEKGRLDALIAANPKINEAFTKRKAMWDKVQSEYVEALSPYKPGVEDMFKENYYRHQVLDYVTNNGIFGTGKRLRPPTNKGYTKARTGASNLYNTDYLEAEHSVMAQMLHDVETAKTLTKIQIGEDISAEIKGIAKAKGIADWHEAIPEGYTVWQPKEGNMFHPVLSVSEKTAETIMTGQIDEILAGGKNIFKEVLAVGGKRKEWVVRQEVADTLDNLTRERAKGIISSVDLGVMTAWKKWQLISPRRYPKYQLRNLTGDAEATFLGNMSGFKKVPQAIKELRNVFFGKKEMPPDMAAWFDRGGVGSTLQAQEMDGLKKMWMFSRLYEKGGADTGLWNKYWKAARLTTDFRESVLRYANYLDFKEQLIKNGGKPIKYGASKPAMIDGLQNIDDKAYWLSNDLLGAYDRISVAGQVIRERAIPFWSWQEVNFKRYIQLYKNAANDGELATTIGQKLGATTAHTAFRVGSLAIKTAAFASMLAVYNNTVFKEEEKQLPADVRTRPHIITGTDEKGNIEYFNRMGTLDDFISWFGLDSTPRFIGEYLAGKKPIKEILQDQVKKTLEAPVNKVIGGAIPLTKMIGEQLTRKSTFPDIFRPGTIRDRYLHIARSFGLENEYIAMTGKPSKGYGESLKGLLIYKIDPGEAAFRTTYDLKNDFMKKLGRTSEGFWLTPTGDALYNMKLALKYDDKKAFTKYFTEYVSLAGEQGRTREQVIQGLKSSIATMHPLYGMNDKVKASFINSLKPDDQDTLLKAVKFHKEVLQR